MATINLGSIKFNWKGAFNNSTAYAVDDVVSSGGNSYVCIQASQGNAVGNATAYWNIMSSAGAAGAEGGTSTLTTRGDLLTRGASAVARLAKGTAGQVLGQGANDPAWVNGSSSTLTTQGDLLYRDGSGLQRLAKGTAAQQLAMNSAANAPEWITAGGGITMADQWRLSANFTGDANPIASNLERVDQTIEGTIGNAMTVSSGIFTFPYTGIYAVTFQISNTLNGNSRYCQYDIKGTVDNSSYAVLTNGTGTITHTSGNNSSVGAYLRCLLDIANVSTHKVKFNVNVLSDSTETTGSSTAVTTGMSFTRLGDR